MGNAGGYRGDESVNLNLHHGSALDRDNHVPLAPALIYPVRNTHTLPEPVIIDHLLAAELSCGIATLLDKRVSGLTQLNDHSSATKTICKNMT